MMVLAYHPFIQWFDYHIEYQGDRYYGGPMNKHSTFPQG